MFSVIQIQLTGQLEFQHFQPGDNCIKEIDLGFKMN